MISSYGKGRPQANAEIDYELLAFAIQLL